MRAIITGGRDFDDAAMFALGMSLCPWSDRITVVLSGACGLELVRHAMRFPPYAKGADGMGERWAVIHGIPFERHYANWKRGKRAGPERNRLMASLADACILFPGGSGTASMREAAEAYDLHLFDAGEAMRAMRASAAYA